MLNPTARFYIIDEYYCVGYIFAPIQKALLFKRKSLAWLSNFLNSGCDFLNISDYQVLFIKLLKESKFIIDPSFNLDKPEKPKTELKTNLLIEVTNNCNLNCQHCFGNFGISDNHKSYLSLDQINRIFERFDFIEHITISGGEPLSHPKIEQILISSLDRAKSVRLNSNGTIYKRNLIKYLKLCESLQISIYGTDKISFNEFTNQKRVSFELFCENILRYKNEGVNIVLTYTQGELNNDKLYRYYEFAEKFSLKLKVGMCMPYGRAKKNRSNMEYLKEKDLFDNIRYSIEKSPTEFRFESCDSTNYVIKSSGDLVPCTFLRTPILGNIIKTDIAKIRESDMFKSFKKKLSINLNLICNQCAFKFLCGGLCPPMQSTLKIKHFSQCPFKGLFLEKMTRMC